MFFRRPQNLLLGFGVSASAVGIVLELVSNISDANLQLILALGTVGVVSNSLLFWNSCRPQIPEEIFSEYNRAPQARPANLGAAA